MTMQYKAESFSIQERNEGWREFGKAVTTFLKNVSNRENVITGAPWPAPSRRRG